MTQQDDITQRGLIERLTEIANRDSAVAVTVRADDLRALLSKLRAPVADERAAFKQAWRNHTDLAEDPLTDSFVHPSTQSRFAGWLSRAALASAPVADARVANIHSLISRFRNATRDDAKNGGRAYFEAARAIEDELRQAVDALASAPVAESGQPIGYVAARELSRLNSGHDANLRSAKFGPSTLDGDVPVYLEPAKAGTDESTIRRALVMASNYIDTLGGDSRSYRAALASAPVPVLKDWRIDTSAGGPILVYKDCSVIESAQAEYVLRLIAADQASAPVAGEAPDTYRNMLLEAVHRYGNARAMAEHDIKQRGQISTTVAAILDLLDAAPQASAEDVRNAALEEAAHLMEQTGKRIAASDIRALKTQADKDGGQQRKRYVVLKSSRSRYAYVNDTQEGRSINRFDVLKGDGWKYAHEFADRMNKEHERAALSATQAEQGERGAD